MFFHSFMNGLVHPWYIGFHFNCCSRDTHLHYLHEVVLPSKPVGINITALLWNNEVPFSGLQKFCCSVKISLVVPPYSSVDDLLLRQFGLDTEPYTKVICI